MSSLKWEEYREGEELVDDDENTTVTGEMEVGGQLHFHLETHSTICRWMNLTNQTKKEIQMKYDNITNKPSPRPNEEGGLDVTCSTQYIDMVQRVSRYIGRYERNVHFFCR